MSNVPKCFNPKTIDFSKEKIPAFLVSLYASFALLIINMIKIPLPFTFVPIVLVLQAIFILSWKLGAKKATLAVLFFLLQGSLIQTFHIGPSLGYLIGYLLAAFFIGYLSDLSKQKSTLKTLHIFNFATLLVYFAGFAVLFPLIGVKQAVLIGVLPFIVPDLLKNILTVKLLEKLK